jgi:SWI/SNF-related matrix-associated actin-dependent regulator 1 of chromatin subfamily A
VFDSIGANRTDMGMMWTGQATSSKVNIFKYQPMSLFSKLFHRKPTAVASTEKPVQSTVQSTLQSSKTQSTPKLTWVGFRWEIENPGVKYQEAKDAGFHYDFKNKRLWTGLTDLAKLYEYCADASAKARFNREAEQVKMSRAVDSNFDIPAPEGLAYLNFQKAGVAYALTHRDSLNADEMGLGKTVQACGLINADPSTKNILIVCPASLKLNWQRELERWLVRKYTCGFATSTVLPGTQIVIANYEIMSKLRSQVDRRSWDLLICDESHYCKNPDSQRTKAVLGAVKHDKAVKTPIDAVKRLFLTGTPILNRPIELWPMLRVIDPEGLGANYWNFVRRFCGAWDNSPWGWDVNGASNLETLQEQLRSRIMIRRLKKDVLTELPPKRRQIVALPSTAVKSIVQRECNFYISNQAMIEEAIAKAEIAQKEGDKESYDAAARDLKGLRQTAFEEISRLRHDTAVAKVPYLIDYLENALEQENKIVLFAHHQDVINPIVDKFTAVAVKFDGTMSNERKQQAVDRFQHDPKCKLFVGSVTAAGVGITLTAASYVLFAELDWRPAILSQAEDRVHRIGQKVSVLAQHVVFDGSLDANMAKKIIEKQEIIDKAIG